MVSGHRMAAMGSAVSIRCFAGLTELFDALKSRSRTALEFDGGELHAGAVRAYAEVGLLR